MASQHQLLNILCSVQRALLGNVTPNLRAVFVIIESETYFKLVFYYDKPPSEDEEELASLTDTEVIAAFSSPFYKTDFCVKVIPYPTKILQEGHCVYKRYEA